MSNRLAAALSPYLRQHADNPVHWQEWGPEALAEAKDRDVPILLSVGYAACHWCHVMAHESFDSPEVAAALNPRFVCIKVDREERPDIDTVYMSAVTAMTGRGGWPMTVFLTPSGEPFQAGTYYPKATFLQLIEAISQAWTQSRERVLEAGGAAAEHLRQWTGDPTAYDLSDADLRAAVRELEKSFDPLRGGFGGAPKFPPSMVLEFLLRHYARTGDPGALTMVETTCEAMARGGIYDQLAGGFARYAVDAQWVVPHFEKMLYDNALLLRVYAHWFAATGSPLAERVVAQTAGFLLGDLLTAEGAFASSLDADSAGVEGLTYVWTPDQLTDVLGHDDGARAALLLDVTADGTFEEGASTLQLRRDPDDWSWWDDVRSRLLEARRRRPQPALDDKIVTSWNGLAIAALADAGVIFDEPRWIDAAARCADFVTTRHRVDGILRRVSRDGQVGSAWGLADDYANLADGLLALHQATMDPRWLTVAEELLDEASGRFIGASGAIHDTAADAESLFVRPVSGGDNAEPSGQSALAGALLTSAALTTSPARFDQAQAALAQGGAIALRQPRFGGWTLAVAEALAAGPLAIAVVGTDGSAAQLLKAAQGSTSPGRVIAHGETDAPGIPLLAQRPLVHGQSAAYVCRGTVCDQPVTEVAALRRAVGHSSMS